MTEKEKQSVCVKEDGQPDLNQGPEHINQMLTAPERNRQCSRNRILQQSTFSSGPNNRPKVNRKRVDLSSPVNELGQSDIGRMFCSPTVLLIILKVHMKHSLGHIICQAM